MNRISKAFGICVLALMVNTGFGQATIAAKAKSVPASGIIGIIPAANEPARTGDVTNPQGSTVNTLPNVNSNVGPCGDATHVGITNLNAKGLATGCTLAAISASSGLGDPGTNGFVYRSAANTTAPGTVTQLQALLGADTVNSTSYAYRTGSGGDSTCPTPVSGSSFTCQKGGLLQVSLNGAAYTPFLNGVAAPSASTLTDGTTVTYAEGGISGGLAVLTLIHTTSARTLNVTGLVANSSFNLILKEDSTGVAGTFTLGTGCTWLLGGSTGFTSATTLTLTSTASATNIASVLYDGTNCYVNLR